MSSKDKLSAATVYIVYATYYYVYSAARMIKVLRFLAFRGRRQRVQLTKAVKKAEYGFCFIHSRGMREVQQSVCFFVVRLSKTHV